MKKEGEELSIDDIIAESLAGDISASNLRRLSAWRDESYKNEQTYFLLKQAFDAKFVEPKYINYKSLEEKIISKVYKEGKGKINLFAPKFSLFYKVAASFVIFALASALLYYINVNARVEQANIETKSDSVVKYNPLGQKSRIVLPDNSIVWLNSDSKLTYQSGFNSSKRFIELEGEAYFEVTKDVSRPFIVQSGSIKTIALGTSFNIRYYQNEDLINVSLLTGKVRVETADKNDEDYLLDPNQQLKFTKDAEFLSKENFDQDNISIWKDGIVIFEKSDFEFVLQSLERTYDVSFDSGQYSKTNWSYTGQFDNMSLEMILKRIGYSENFDFNINGKKITLIDK